MSSLILFLVVLALLMLVVLAVWVDGVARRMDRLEKLVLGCETAIAEGKHIRYEELDCD